MSVFKIAATGLSLLALAGLPLPGRAAAPKPQFFAADNPRIQYTGRVDFSNAKKPRFWAPGVYLTVRFQGPSCTVQLTDEVLYGKNHNYVHVLVDGQESRRQLTGPTNTLVVAEGLANTAHTQPRPAAKKTSTSSSLRAATPPAAAPTPAWPSRS